MTTIEIVKMIEKLLKFLEVLDSSLKDYLMLP